MEERFRLPLIPALLAYGAGLFLGHLPLPFLSQRLIILIAVFLVFWMLTLLFRKSAWGSWFGLALFLSIGCFTIQVSLHPRFSPSHIARYVGAAPVSVEGVVDRPPARSQQGAQVIIQCQKVILSNHPHPATGRLLLFLKNEGELLHPGDRIRLRCKLYPPRGFHNPGVFSYERYLAFQEIHALGFPVEGLAWVKLGEGEKAAVVLWIEKKRDHIRGFLDREAGAPASSLLKALVLGEQGTIPDEVKDAFAATGTAHLLAISGDHLGIVALLSVSLLIWLMKRSRFLLLAASVRKLAALLTLPCILLYTFIAGGGISVIRATIMVVIFFLSILLGRERNLLHTLGLAAFLILILSPASLFDVSFQLSFLAVLSILYLVPGMLRLLGHKEILPPQEITWRRRIWKYLRLSLLVTAVATAGTAPLVVLHFNRISPIGLFTNLLIVPWVGFVIVPLALVASLLSFFLYPVAALLIHLGGLLTGVLLQAVHFFASVPLASFYLSTPTVVEILLFYALLFLLPHLPRGRRVKTLCLVLCLVLAVDLVYWQVKDIFQRDLRVTFIDVGHGDSILVEFPGGKKMLIDGGGLPGDSFDVGRNVLAPFLWSKKIRRIDTLVLTHPDPDHSGGLTFIASHFTIGGFWSSGVRGLSDAYAGLEAALLGKGVQMLSRSAADSPETIGEAVLSFLNPPPLRERTGPRHRQAPGPFSPNNLSLVMRIQFKSATFLLPGDIETEAERRISAEAGHLKADVLKVPHHGSLSSSTPGFLQRVNPTYAVLSVGQRSPGHLPHPEILGRYRQRGARIFQTDRHGAVTVTTDGKDLRVSPFRNPEDDAI